MTNFESRRVCSAVFLCGLVLAGAAAPAAGNEIWVAPTMQQDVGGFGIGSNVAWPVTAAGAVRLAWGVPEDLQSFTRARLVLIPHAPGGAATLSVYVCAANSGDMVAAACTGPVNHPFTGVANQLLEVDITAAIAPQVGLAGTNHLAVVAYTTPTTATDHIVGLRFAYDAGTPPGVATLGANTFSGTQIAPAFVGNGSGLTNLPFPAGAATVGANTFIGTQAIDGANLDLDPSTAVAGSITKNGTRFLHDFGVANVFLGANAGNFTMPVAADGNTAVGASALRNVTTGAGNTALGVNALTFNTTGVGNTAVGGAALLFNTSGGANTASGVNSMADNIDGSRNTANGHSSLRENTNGFSNTANGVSALHFNTTGSRNTAVGDDALRNNSTGSRNVAVGWNAGLNATTGLHNIYLGADVVGEAGESNTMYLGRVGTQTKTVIAGVRGTSVAGGEMVLVDADGRLGSGPVATGANTVGTGEVIDGSLAPADVAFNYAGSASKGGPASDLACAGCVGPAEVSFSFATLAANTFTGTQAINAGNLDVDLSTPAAGLITQNGTRILHTFGFANTFLGTLAGNLTMTGEGNTGLGREAFRNNESGSHNTAVGTVALLFNTSGTYNTAVGRESLARNTTANANTSVGFQALSHNTTGEANTATGTDALEQNVTGNFNTAVGAVALQSNVSGSGNVAVGTNALDENDGNNNVAVGAAAGANATTGSNNIYVGANVLGVAGESNTMYLGKVGTQTKTLIAGVRGITTGNPDAIPVVIDSAGQLGTISSSRRFKEDIRDMGAASERLLQLRPVTFRYTQPFAGGAKPIQYGLIAEEVAAVFPDLVVTGADGQVETVQYHKLDAMFVNELQKLYREVQALKAEIARLQQSRDERK